MDKDDKSSGGLPSGGLVMVALVAAGALFISSAPLETSRPALADSQLERRDALQNVDARLWQDPFSAVAKAREPLLKQAGGQDDDRKRNGLQRFADEMKRQARAGGNGGVVVVTVMMSGGPYAEQVESRRRTRYAVLAGLKARGFVPTDNAHLGYFHPWDGKEVRTGLPETIPFESLESEPDTSDRCGGCKLMLLWLDSSAFFEWPLGKLATLATLAERPSPNDPADKPAAPRVRWRVLGPASSDGLRAIIDEAAGTGFDKSRLKSIDLRLYSAAATAPDAALLRNVHAQGDATVSDYLLGHDVPLLRTIGTDDRLARALVNELELRGLRTRPPNGRKVKCPDADSETAADPEDLPSSIAIVSEGDTLYGRSLRQQFRYDAVSDRPGFCVTRWHYFQGIDGRLPGDGPSQAADRQGGSNTKDAGADARVRDGSYIERPEGSSQYDYLRRLAIRIREEDATLRKRHGREYGIRAIGVLGNDVYDKLLVLQALQTEMPHAIFFTTDLDARLFHPREQAWARNLIVSSNFGLRLANPLQRDIAPFRDSYQSSAYLATMLLVSDLMEPSVPGAIGKPRWAQRQKQVNAWFEKPRLYEVSRAGAFDFSEPAATARTASPGAWHAPAEAATRCSRRAIETCRDIHPAGSSMVPAWTMAARFAVFSALTLLLWLPALVLSRRAKRQLRRLATSPTPHTPSRPLRVSLLVLAAAALTVGLPLLLASAWPQIAEAITRDGKPLSFTDGISPWPTYGIRLLTLVLCLYFVVRAWSSLAANVNRIARDFRLGDTRHHLDADLAAENPGPWRTKRMASMLSVRFYRDRPPHPAGDPAAMTPNAERFWKHYLLQNRASARLLRTLLCVATMVAISELITRAIGDAPIAPLRGDLTATMQSLTTQPTSIAILFLVFFVVDATVLSVLFVRGLRLHHANWPQRTLQQFNASTGLPVEHLDDWIDLQFIARRTRCVGTLVYYPFIVLSLMLLARSPFFDAWYTPPSVAVLAALSFAIVLTCAWALRHSAETSRRLALDHLHDAILRAKGAASGPLVSQLETLRDRVDRLREGAFAPYSQQPLLKAVLLPFLTFGGSSLFDYLTLANI